MKTGNVVVGMSGGVDSSVAAALLKEQGYSVTGVYMKNWAQDIPGFPCPWKDDVADAKRVAVQLGIDFEIYDFQAEYKEKVVHYLIDGYRKGVTPNPDIMCNQEIKFKVFLEAAMERGADYIATGHYARTEGGHLLVGVDTTKDQSYFLYRVSSGALQKTLFPLGDLRKEEVRALAHERRLVTADKKESMGICFVGKVGIKEFLEQYVQLTPGPIIDTTGQVIGQHEGAMIYTIGQRHGLGVGGGLPYYVVGKDIAKNEVYVSTVLDDDRLWSKQVKLTQTHWIVQRPQKDASFQARFRHRGPLSKVVVATIGEDSAVINLDAPVRAITPGQSCVLYDGDRVVGGGIIVDGK